MFEREREGADTRKHIGNAEKGLIAARLFTGYAGPRFGISRVFLYAFFVPYEIRVTIIFLIFQSIIDRIIHREESYKSL